VLYRSGGQAPDRRLRAFLIDVRSGEVVVSLTRGVVVSSRVLLPSPTSSSGAEHCWSGEGVPGRADR
jgi:hypothetical protein